MEIKEIEKNILDFWKKDKTFEKSLEKNDKKNSYVFYDGPPFATGLPHYGHILGSTAKDLFGRLWTMKGKYVRRVWGWDCHGLPIENIAESEIGIKSKKEIEEMGVKKFNEFCRSKVLTYADEWKKTVERMARWVEFDGSYKTMDNDYIESVWWAFKKLYDKKLIYEGEKILMYCPRCATPLSKSEITMDNSYKTVKDQSITVKFKLKDEDAYLLAWTTTPWTLPSNMALAVNPDLDYVYLKDNSDGTVYILSKNLVERYFRDEKEYEILKEVKGKELEKKEYVPLLPYFEDLENAFKVIVGEFVSDEDGTGIVHIAPAFGEDDYNVGKANKIPLIQPVDDQGKFTDDIVDFKGEYIFDVNKKVIDKLKKENKIVKIEKIEHEYPFCYRCETPLIYRAIPSWFVDIQKIKDKVLKLNEKINWYPKFLKEGRFKKNVESAPDWNISRNRYWATAMPIWKCEDESCNEMKVLGSIEELKKEAVKLKGKVDLHKHYLDEVKLKCNCGKEMKRIPEVLDCWFESGCMPFAQFHYPFENKEEFEKSLPSQFVAEYIGQVRAWFYYMLVISTILYDEIPFENVVTTGTILAEDGSKMSKSKKNYPDPAVLFEKYGVDSLRFYLLQGPVMNAENMNFSEKGVEEIYRKVLLLMYNSSKFYLLNKESEKSSDKSSEITDKWIISRLNETGLNVNKYLEEYNTIKSCDEIRSFVDDLSTWYVRLNRDRIAEEKQAKETLKFVLEELSKITAPITPFVSEKIFQDLNGENKSVHLEDWPKFNQKKVDSDLLEKMTKVREIVSAGLRERDKLQIGLRWPLSKIKISVNEKEVEGLNEIIKEQLNVKKIEFDSSENKEISIELDTKMTPELEEEGYSRELVRHVQAFRKKLGLSKEDEINLIVSVADKELLGMYENKKEYISEKTNSKKVEFVATLKETFKNRIGFSIKRKEGVIVIN